MKKQQANIEVLDHMFEGAYTVNKERKITSWNAGAQRITGFSFEDVKDKYCFDNILNHIDENGIALCFNGCPLHATISDGKVREANVYLQHKQGYRIPITVKTIPLYDKDNMISGSLEFFTENRSDLQLRSSLEKYQKESSEDSLTGIPNRRYLEAMLESKDREHRSLGLTFGIAFIDIDNFKKINDFYGHESGDNVLKLIVNTIQTCLRKRDFIGRWGGEEFIVVLTDVTSETLLLVSEKIRKLVEASTLRLKEEDIQVTISIGSTIASLEDTSQSLISRADDLMYQSKINGKNKTTLG